MSLNKIKKFLRETIGLEPDSLGQALIDNAIRKHMKQCSVDDETDYLSLLRTSSEACSALTESVVINETWFFRQPEAFDCLSTHLRKNIHTDYLNKKIRILSIGCASGEEPFSIAITLLNMGITPEHFIIDALDISKKALKTAESGIYTENSFDKNQDLAFRKSYFTACDKHYKLNKRVHDCVNFIGGNVTDTHLSWTKTKYDIIFCRNLLIYLCEDARKRLLKLIDSILVPNGIVFVGAAETGEMRSNGFSPNTAPAAFAFERKPVTQPDARENPEAPQKSRLKADHDNTPPIMHRSKVKTPIKQTATEVNAVPDVPPDHCWLIHGIKGDRSCTRLEHLITCLNCPVCISYGRQFLDRTPPDAYLADWKSSLTQSKEEQDNTGRHQFVIFRLGSDLFAFSSRVIKEISALQDIHKIPYKSGKILLGIANCSGDLRLCASLSELIDPQNHPPSEHAAQDNERAIYRRMITVHENHEIWVFPVDEIIGVQHVYVENINSSVPPNLKAATYAESIITIPGNQTIVCLDHRLLFDSLRRNVR